MKLYVLGYDKQVRKEAINSACGSLGKQKHLNWALRVK